MIHTDRQTQSLSNNGFISQVSIYCDLTGYKFYKNVNDTNVKFTL